MFIRKVHIALAVVVLVAQMIASSAPAFAAEKTTGQQPLPQNQEQPHQKDKPPINEGIVVDPAHNAIADPSTNDSSDASKTQGIVSTHCAPGFELINNQCSPKDDKSSTGNSKDDPILIHCSLGTGCSKEDSDAPKDDDKSSSSSSKGDASSQQAVNPSDEPGQMDNSGTVYGCPGDYDYDTDSGVCFPSDADLNFASVLAGDEPWPNSAGGYVGFAGGVIGDPLQVAGTGLQLGVGYVEDALLWYGEDGGPIGYGIQGLGYTIGFAGDAAGALVQGAGEIVNGVADGAGEVIDDIGSAAGDAWDEVSSWF